MNDLLIPQARAADYLEVSVNTLKKYRRQGFFNPVEIASLVMYSKSELDDFRHRYSIRQGRVIKKAAN